MKLFNAILTTGLIACVVTLAAFAQPEPSGRGSEPLQMAEAKKDTQPSFTQATQVTPTSRKVHQLPDVIYGVTRHLPLEKADEIQAAFDERRDIYNRFKPGVRQFYILYSHFGDLYSRANITMGASADSFYKVPEDKVSLPVGNTRLIAKGSNTSAEQLVENWSDIRFGPDLIAVVERYNLTKAGDLKSVDLYEITRKK